MYNPVNYITPLYSCVNKAMLPLAAGAPFSCYGIYTVFINKMMGERFVVNSCFMLSMN